MNPDRMKLLTLFKRHIESELMIAPLGKKQSQLAALASQYADCQRCPLAGERTMIVTGSGDPDARVMIIGEAPGAEEDTQGIPFVGRSGQLLEKMLEAISLKREDVFITNIVKCRPPKNRPPEPEEIKACHPFLTGQIKIVNPELIVTLGSFAAKTLLALGEKASISSIRGKFFIGQIPGLDRTIPCLPTFHPAYLLRNPAAKKESWEDLKKIRTFLTAA